MYEKDENPNETGKTQAGQASRDVSRDAARNTARNTARDAARNTARDATRDVSRDAARDAAREDATRISTGKGTGARASAQAAARTSSSLGAGSDFSKTLAKWQKALREHLRLFFAKDLQGAREEMAAQALRARVILAIFLAMGGYLFTRLPLPFGARPLGLALLAAARLSDAWFVLPGLLIASFFGQAPVIWFLAPLFLLLTRLLVRRSAGLAWHEGEEPAVIRMALACAGSFLAGFAQAAYEGFALDAVWALLIEVLAAPAAAFFFSHAMSSAGKESKEGASAPLLLGEGGALREVGRCLLLFFAVYALHRQGLFGLSLGWLAGYFLTLVSAYRGGALRGGVIGLLAGAACGLSMAPVMALAGLFVGLLAEYQLAVSVVGGALVAAGLKYVAGGFDGLVFFVGEILFASLVFLPLAKSGFFSSRLQALFPSLPLSTLPREAVEPREKKGVRPSDSEKKRLAALSAAFDGLSSLLAGLSEKSRQPGRYAVKTAVDDVFDRHCASCSLASHCKTKQKEDRLAAKETVVSALLAGDTPKSADLPPFFSSGCRKTERLLQDAVQAAEALWEAAMYRDKTALFAKDYEAMAELLASVSEEDEETVLQKELTRQLSSAFRSLGIFAAGFGVYGNRQKLLTAAGIEIGSLSVSAGELHKTLERELGLLLTQPRFDFDSDRLTMTATSLPPLAVEHLTAGKALSGEAVSGDTVSVFEAPTGYCCLLICDGMGSGRTAAVASRIAASFLEHLLVAGVPAPVIFKMVSSFLLARSEECHATADLCRLDLFLSRAEVTKCGAAPSFLLHAGTLIRLEGRSAPLGILRDVLPATLSADIAPGDLVIQISDGLLPLFEPGSPLIERLPAMADLPLPELRDAILSSAPDSDDVSLILARIKQA